jgi:hypothetical protein
MWGLALNNLTLGSASVPASTLTYTITGLPSGTTIFFAIFALSGLCASSTSVFGSTTTSASICSAGTTFANAWAARVVTNGGAMPSQNTINTVATLQCGLIADGLNTKMIAWSLIVPDSLTAALSPQQVGDDSLQLWVNNNFVGGDLTVNGLQGNGTTKSINPQSTINTGIRSAQSIGLFVYTSAAGNAANGRALGGLQSVSGNPFLLIGTHDNTANCFGGNGANPGNLITTPSQGAGFYADQRISATDHRLYYGSSISPLAQIGATDAAAYNGVLPNSDPYIFGVNQGGSLLLISNETISAVGMTTGLTSNDVTNLFARFQTARQSLGGGFV